MGDRRSGHPAIAADHLAGSRVRDRCEQDSSWNPLAVRRPRGMAVRGTLDHCGLSIDVRPWQSGVASIAAPLPAFPIILYVAQPSGRDPVDSGFDHPARASLLNVFRAWVRSNELVFHAGGDQPYSDQQQNRFLKTKPAPHHARRFRIPAMTLPPEGRRGHAVSRLRRFRKPTKTSLTRIYSSRKIADKSLSYCLFTAR